MQILSPELLKNIFTTQKETSLFGKWITFKNIENLFLKHQEVFEVKQLGFSEHQRPIYKLKIGSGKKKILLWSQMHGNESTGTKALFDLFNCFSNCTDEEFKVILKECTLVFIPMLNPDGSEAFTRVNGNNIDLNRDAVDRLAKESNLLRAFLEEFNPQFCFNLHDQRTIFGLEGSKKPATISFLAPSEDETRKVTPTRKKTMNVIVAMNNLLQQIIPNHIGRYTDTFYPKATGDNFQKLGYSTILIESGHYKKDYQREKVREFTFISILQGLYHISIAKNYDDYNAYFKIPNNNESFRDILHIHPKKPNEVFQYDEVLEKTKVKFIPNQVFGDISELFFHKEIVFVR